MSRYHARRSARIWLAFLLAALLAAVLAPVGPAAAQAGSLIIYPAPASLNGVDNLRISDDYSLTVDGLASPVYKSANSWTSGQAPRPESSASFSAFSFSGRTVRVVVSCVCTVSSVTIRPRAYGISPSFSGGTLVFDMPQPHKLVVEINGNTKPLLIFADAPESSPPSQGGPGLHYFGPGVHHIGLDYRLQSGETMYIAGGAVVEGTVRADDGSSNVTIRGRGILISGQWPWKSGNPHPGSIWAASASGLTVEGIQIIDSPGWNIRTTFDGSGFTARNLKLLGWKGNTDGPWGNGTNILIEDNFIFNNDDAFTVHTGSNVVIRDNVISSGTWGRVFFGWDLAKNGFTIDNTIVVRKASGPVIKYEHASGRSDIGFSQNITYSNLHVEQHPAALIEMEVSDGDYSGLTFRNVTVDNRNSNEGSIIGSSGGSLSGLTMENVRIGGVLITTLAQGNISTNSYVTGVTFPNPASYDLLSEDLEDGAANGWTTTAGTWSVGAEGSQTYRQSATSGEGLTSGGHPAWQNSFVQANVKILSPGNAAGIVGRYQDAGNFYHLRLHEGAEKLQLYKRVGGSFTLLGEYALTVNTGQWHTLRLVMSGSTITGYLNGVARITRSDSAHSQGMIGLRTFDGSAAFDAIGAGHN